MMAHGVWQTRGHEMLLVETPDTTATATEHAYALAQQACNDTVYIIVKPNDISTFVVFQGGRLPV